MMVTDDDATELRPGATKLNVYAPLPVMLRLVNVATPLAFVVAVCVPLNAPEPLARFAVTTTPA